MGGRQAGEEEDVRAFGGYRVQSVTSKKDNVQQNIDVSSESLDTE